MPAPFPLGSFFPPFSLSGAGSLTCAREATGFVALPLAQCKALFLRSFWKDGASPCFPQWQPFCSSRPSLPRESLCGLMPNPKLSPEPPAEGWVPDDPTPSDLKQHPLSPRSSVQSRGNVTDGDSIQVFQGQNQSVGPWASSPRHLGYSLFTGVSRPRWFEAQGSGFPACCQLRFLSALHMGWRGVLLVFPLLCPQTEVDVLPMFSRESHHAVCLFAGVRSVLAKTKHQAGTGWLSLHIPAPFYPQTAWKQELSLHPTVSSQQESRALPVLKPQAPHQ